MSKCEDCIHSIVCFKRSMKESLELQEFELDCHRFVGKDVVEVVRCKDCKFFMEYATLHKATVEKGDGDCHIRLMNSENRQFCAVEKSDFCSYGERKDS